LAYRSRLAKTASLDRPQKTPRPPPQRVNIPVENRQNLPRRLSTPEIHIARVVPTRYTKCNTKCRKSFGPGAELDCAAWPGPEVSAGLARIAGWLTAASGVGVLSEAVHQSEEFVRPETKGVAMGALKFLLTWGCSSASRRILPL